jgi:cytochrome c-type biogenesis protein CcmF
MPFGQMLAWKRGDLLGAAQRLVLACALGLVGMVVLYALRGGSVVPAILAGLAVYLTIGSFTEIYGRLRGAQNASSVFARAMGLPRSAWGTAIAHAGVGLTLFGLAATGWGVERIVSAKINEPIAVGPYEVVVTDIAPRDGSNYKDLVAHTQIREGGRVVAEMDPSRRSFTTRTMVRTEAGIVTLGLGQVYMNIADVRIDGAIDLRLYWKPYVALIWLGALVMSLGGLLSMADRRLRIGIAKRAAARVQTAAAE